MSLRFLRFFTCQKAPTKSREYNRKSASCSSLPITPILSERESSSLDPLIELEIFGHTKAGFGEGKFKCQDTFYIQPKVTHNSSFFAVYDGHGPNGFEVSQYVNERIAQALQKEGDKLEKLYKKGQICSFFRDMFLKVDQKLKQARIDSFKSGTCCISVFVIHNKCYVMNVGDSRAVLCRKRNIGTFQTIELSEDHKPERPEEKERILQKGGVVESIIFDGSPVGPLRVWTPSKDSGIAMTRTLGDDHGKRVGLIAEPEIREIDLHSHDQFIIAASDGVWDVMSSTEAVEFVFKYIEKGGPKNQAASALALEAEKRWELLEDYEFDPYCDDITVIVAFPRFYDGRQSFNK